MKVGIIDYKCGNVTSVAYALSRLGASACLSADPTELDTCDKIIFPGVGHATPAMKQLTEAGLDRYIRQCTKPVLGICLGMQLMCASSEEGNTTCLGIFDVPVKKFLLAKRFKIPHVGWNHISGLKGDLFEQGDNNEYMYFVHTYHVPDNKYLVANCFYGVRFCAAMQKDNYYAVQFHPEKSGRDGERLLKRFLSL